MVRIGEPPFLECSSAGEKRFSAFYAQVLGHPIEVLYQAAKVFPDGRSGLSWREAKGRRPINQEQCAALYTELWRLYLHQHPELVRVLHRQTGLQDRFGKPGHICQAVTLWQIKAEFS